MIIYTHTTPGVVPPRAIRKLQFIYNWILTAKKKVKPKMITSYNRQKLFIATEGLLPKINSGG